MNNIVSIQNLDKKFKNVHALKSVDLEIPTGRIVGFVGPNGAGKTTLLRAITGQIPYEGKISIFGLNPETQRTELMKITGVIHDTSVLPPWMKVSELLEFLARAHPNFDKNKCKNRIAETSISLAQKIKNLSKGMKTQLHLAVVMATETKILILDEPTHGLDILFRKKLYSQVLEEYFDEEKSVVISTHQIEEVEHILSDVIFIKEGKVLLTATMDELSKRFVQVVVANEKREEIRKMNPLSEISLFGKTGFLLEKADREKLEKLGEISVPSVADVFVALMGGEK
ncbi:ABC transporter ATP-binding protein [bacterium]|nr:ABC transporter ATP-binding protein [bacterium]